MDVILVPGLWLDGSSWDEVVPVLRAGGHRAHAVTLPGMEPGAGAGERARIGLADHVGAVVALIDGLGARAGPVVLVGHSGGGAVVHGALDARPERVARAVYVDSWPLGEGGVVNDSIPEVGGELPLPDWSFFDDEDLVDLDDGLRAAFRRRAVPSPAGAARDPQRLPGGPRRYEVPVTVIACEFAAATLRGWMAAGEPALRELARVRDVAYAEVRTGHWPQFTRPGELGRAILAALTPPPGEGGGTGGR